ncbi:MAG: mRNA surveillance protein pelota [Candidatus Undinarchaeales archaeon]
MKILNKDLKSGKIAFRIEVADDLFYLDSILTEGDIVASKTRRRVEVHSQNEIHRSERIPKKTMTLAVKVEDIEFDKNVDRLRVKGKITDSPEGVPTGDFHTLNLKPGMKFRVEKEDWSSADFALISDASKIIKADILLLAIDSDYCGIGKLRNYGVKPLGNISSSMSGKEEVEKREQEEQEFFSRILKALKTEENPDKIIIAGPGFVKNSFFKYLKENEPELAEISNVESVSVSGEKGLQEIVNRGIIERVVKEWKVQSEVESLKTLFEGMEKESGLVSFGLEEVKKASEMGAVSTFMISNDLLRKAKAEKNKEIENLLDTVQKTKGDILIVSGEHDYGKQLEGVGGVASLNRYKVK